MENLYLAVFTLRTAFYDGGGSAPKDKVVTLTRIIIADDMVDAERKLHKKYKVDYHDLKFEYDYSSSNSFDEVDITEAIK